MTDALPTAPTAQPGLVSAVADVSGTPLAQLVRAREAALKTTPRRTTGEFNSSI